jgi:hypothetical protein
LLLLLLLLHPPLLSSFEAWLLPTQLAANVMQQGQLECRVQQSWRLHTLRHERNDSRRRVNIRSRLQM